jgi:hypothetical protein
MKARDGHLGWTALSAALGDLRAAIAGEKIAKIREVILQIVPELQSPEPAAALEPKEKTTAISSL